VCHLLPSTRKSNLRFGFGFDLESRPLLDAELLQTLLDFFVAITEGVGMVLEKGAFARIERLASLFHSLKVGYDVCCWSLDG